MITACPASKRAGQRRNPFFSGNSHFALFVLQSSISSFLAVCYLRDGKTKCVRSVRVPHVVLAVEDVHRRTGLDPGRKHESCRS
jgi:hypothetical protein